MTLSHKMLEWKAKQLDDDRWQKKKESGAGQQAPLTDRVKRRRTKYSGRCVFVNEFQFVSALLI